MSSQAGVWKFFDDTPDGDLIRQLSDAVTQYGPDRGNTHSDGSVGMLYYPFHTTAESRLEQQPYISPRGFIITWDGRLDNRDDLLLDVHDCLPSTKTDVAIVMAAYERWGTQCLRKLTGDWALCLWDPHDHTLVMARDYLGIRHLYYLLTPDKLIWCTCLAPIVLLSGSTLSLDDRYLAGYLSSLPRADLTPYREIHAVPPGHFVSICKGNTRTQAYWAHDKNNIRYRADAEYEEHFRHVFRQAVRRRLRSDTPILAELSGGLDSSSIVCMADDLIHKAEVQTPRLDTVSLYDPQEPGGDERHYVAKVEEQRHKTGTHINFGESYELFLADSLNFVAVPYLVLNKRLFESKRHALMQAQTNRVLLSGIGGDEFMGGVPDPRPQLADLLVRLRLITLMRQVRDWSAAKRVPWVQLLTSIFHRYPSQQQKLCTWLNPQFERRYRYAANDNASSQLPWTMLPSRRDLLQTCVAMARRMSYEPPPLLGCIEKRYPFLDQDLVEFIISIPADQLLRPRDRRSLMRRALANLLPPEILHRRTKGIAGRSYIIALHSCWPQLESAFTSPLSSSLGYIDKAHLHEALVAAKRGQATAVVHLLRAIALEFWLRNLKSRDLITFPTGREQCGGTIRSAPAS